MSKKIIDEFTDKGTARWRHYNRNKISICLKDKQKRKNNIVKYLQQESVQRETNKENIKLNNSSYKKKNRLRSIYHAAKKRSKEQGVAFDIKYEDIIVPLYCPILNIELFHGVGGACDNSPSIDKIVPELGYIKNNIRVISYKANRYKSDMTREQIQKLLDYIDRKI